MAKILIVDDVADIKAALTMLFEHAGHEVTAAFDAATGLMAARAGGQQLILLNLADCGAITACRALRADPATATVPIIVLTADLLPTDLDAATAGADDYVTKPFTNHDLLARAEALLARRPVPADGTAPR